MDLACVALSLKRLGHVVHRASSNPNKNLDRKNNGMFKDGRRLLGIVVNNFVSFHKAPNSASRSLG
jgi:hypothetical protein